MLTRSINCHRIRSHMTKIKIALPDVIGLFLTVPYFTVALQVSTHFHLRSVNEIIWKIDLLTGVR